MLILAAGCKPGKTERAADGRAATAVTFYVPCGMEMPFMDLEERFEASHPGVDVRLLLDNSHILIKRILEKNERPDAVVSPGGHELVHLVEAGLADADDIRNFGQYDLCLFVPRANTAGVTCIDDLTKPSVKTVAVADPDETSIGYFTVETLKNAGIWDRIQSKVVITGDASQTYKHVASGKADASFAYRSCPLKTAPDKLEYSRVRVIQSVPNDMYGPAYAAAVVLKNARQAALAEEFVQMLLAEDGQRILRSYDLPCLPSQATSTKKQEKKP